MTTETSEHQLLVQALNACGAGDGVGWVLAAETTGTRELDLLIDVGLSRSAVLDDLAAFQVRRWTEVIQPNARDAEAAVRAARATWPEYLVPNLGGLDVPAWTAHSERFRHFKNTVFEQAQVVITGPEWAYSKGERLRLNAALQRSLPICDPTGVPLSTDQLRAEAEAADADIRRRLGAAGQSPAAIDEVLPGVPIG